MEYDAYTAAQCPECGVHHEVGHDMTLMRDVEMADRNTCENCAAIKADRERFHVESGHTDDHCDCDDHVWFVARYLPLTDQEEDD